MLAHNSDHEIKMTIKKKYEVQLKEYYIKKTKKN
jgi:hypothetical protein